MIELEKRNRTFFFGKHRFFLYMCMKGEACSQFEEAYNENNTKIYLNQKKINPNLYKKYFSYFLRVKQREI